MGRKRPPAPWPCEVLAGRRRSVEASEPFEFLQDLCRQYGGELLVLNTVEGLRRGIGWAIRRCFSSWAATAGPSKRRSSDPLSSHCIGPHGKAEKILSASLWHGALRMKLGPSGVELPIRLRRKHQYPRDQAVLQLLEVPGVPLAKEHSSGRSCATVCRFR